MLRLLLTLIISSQFFLLSGQPGSLRSGFGNGGIFTNDITDYDELQHVALLSDGTVVASGYLFDGTYKGVLLCVSDTGEVLWTIVTDVNSDGFNDFFQGVVIIDDFIYVQANSFNGSSGKFEVVVLKYDREGNLVSDFGIDGNAVVNYNYEIVGFDMTTDGNGNLYIPGRAYGLSSSLERGTVIKLDSNGNTDLSFSMEGVFEESVFVNRSGLLDGAFINNSFYAVGWFFDEGAANGSEENGVLMRIDQDGLRANDFGDKGLVVFNESSSEQLDDVVQHGMNHILTIGSSGLSQDDIYLSRYDLQGKRDLEFGVDGTVKIDLGGDDDGVEVLVREDLGIYVCGSFNSIEDFGVLSFNPDGSVDAQFGEDGVLIIDIEDNDNLSEATLLENGDILLAGESNEDDNGDFAIVLIEGYPTCSNIETEQSISGCNSVEFDQVTYDESGTYTLNYESEQGCDSIVRLQVEILEDKDASVQVSECSSATVNDVLYESSGTYNQTLIASNGCDSLLTIQVEIREESAETVEYSICDSLEINGEVFFETGTYEQILMNAAGCDSVLTISITNASLIAEISIDDSNELTCNVEADTYQWYNCDLNETIEGAILQSFLPSTSGTYAAIISNEICVDTSNCLSVVISNTLNITESTVLLYPNPAEDFVNLGGINAQELLNVSILDLAGRQVKIESEIIENQMRIDLRTLADGVYFIVMELETRGNVIQRFVKH